MTDPDRTLAMVETLVEQVQERDELLDRMMTLIESHVARIERLEYKVLGIQPLPAMKTARHDH